MKRNVLIRVSAVIMLIWYSLSIIGFNVHTCSASDRSFIVTFLEDMSCESIHPSDHCGAEQTCCCCCSHHTSEHHSDSDESIDEPDCCTNDYQVLTSTTDVVDDGKRLQSFDRVSGTGNFDGLIDVKTLLRESDLRLGRLTHSISFTRGVHLVCNVWRI